MKEGKDMDDVAGKMRSLTLSEEEKKGVRIKMRSTGKGEVVVAQAVGKVMSKKLAHPEAISLSLGRVWCPIKGISCREIGTNTFIFSFHQESGKRKALEDGPWMFEKDLVVVEDYDPGKRPEDYEFNEIPIWVRVFSLPLDMMNEESAEEIGNIIGEFVDVDAEADGRATEGGLVSCENETKPTDQPVQQWRRVTRKFILFQRFNQCYRRICMCLVKKRSTIFFETKGTFFENKHH